METTFDIPYGLSVDRVIEMLEEVRKKPSITEEELESRMGRSYSRSKSAAIELNLLSIDADRPHLTALGKDLVWAQSEQAKQRHILCDVIIQYLPYKVALTQMVNSESDVIVSDSVQRIWARDLDIRLSQDNLARAVSFFFQLLNSSGIGTPYLGRKGAKTRFVFNQDTKEEMADLLTEGSDTKVLPCDPPEESRQDANICNNRRVLEESSSTSKGLLRTGPTVSRQIDSDWSILETDFFVLKIEKTSEAWDLLSAMLPIYKKKLMADQERLQEERADTDHNLSSSDNYNGK